MSSKPKTPQELGLEFQTDFQRHFEHLRNFKKLEIVRLYDTHAAGSLIPAQGGDFIVMFQKRGIMIDTKLSTIHATLEKCLKSSTSETQMSRMRLWVRAGGLAKLVFFGTHGLEIWNVDTPLLEAYYTPRMKPPIECCEIVYPDWLEFSAGIIDHMKENWR